MADGGSAYYARKSYRTDAVRADNAADFIYGSRLLLSCDLTAARTHGSTAGNAERREERETGSVQV